MARIPQAFIDELLGRANIVDVIGGYVGLKKQGREHVACCPFHGEKTPSFTVSSQKQFYHCFGCGAHGTALGFLIDYARLDFPEAVETLAREVGLEVPREASAEARTSGHAELYEVLARAAHFYRARLRESQRAIDYLKARGLSGRIAADYGLGFAPPGYDNLIAHLAGDGGADLLLRAGLVKENEQGRRYDRFRERIMFPIHDRRGRVVAFGGRSLGEEEPKYLNSPETSLFQKGRTLYGLHQTRKAGARLERVLLVEGYMDVVALAEHGVRNGLATLGTATTREHLEQLFRMTSEVVFCFDGDHAGRSAAWRALEQALPIFRDGLEARFLFLPDGDDPDSLVRREGAQRLDARIADESVTLADFVFQQLSRDASEPGPAGRARLAEQARPLLEKLPEGIFKELMYERLARLVGLGVEKVKPTGEPRVRGTAPRVRQNRYSAVRRSIAMLLHEPALASRVKSTTGLRQLELPGIRLLVELLEMLRESPYLTPAGVLERYRDSENYAHLLRLMEQRAGDAESYAQEFDDALDRLFAKVADRRLEQLFDKERRMGLSREERVEYAQLLGRPPVG